MARLHLPQRVQFVQFLKRIDLPAQAFFAMGIQMPITVQIFQHRHRQLRVCAQVLRTELNAFANYPFLRACDP